MNSYKISVLSFSGVLIAGMLGKYFTSYSCDVIEHYNGIDIYLIGKFLLLFFVKLLLAFAIYFRIKVRLKLNNLRKFKLGFFMLLPIFLFHMQYLQIPKNIYFEHRSIVKSICEKSLSDGMRSKSLNISQKEYDYLNSTTFNLPDLPSSANEINIEYYSDGFLPDFSLLIEFLCSEKEIIETDVFGWKVKEEFVTSEVKKVSYHAFDN